MKYSEAACNSRPDIDFFPTGKLGDLPRARRTAPAIALCLNECGRRVSCARDAIKMGVLHGVIAGVDLGDMSSNGGSLKSPVYRKQVETLYAVAGIPLPSAVA
ncbi:hypothetical protein NONO_c59870 [Nocardia nova SH22a]|uniref:4Fe-4S Wbl-type domain-containing protein n=1 Tax=Nocardia nova SH22a TaxID=1415166 RepID=W5TP86_9NOCA|nr:WhiB family transcriptional regulator [Nocardia nova]AHH20763.1 hypothetical protein NONO_c59870 [Nocardia nova SH22a]